MKTITVSNYNETVTESIVPKQLRTDHETIKSMLDLYDEDKEIKDYIDLYLTKLNESLAEKKTEKPASKPKSKTVKKLSPKSATRKSSIKRKVKPTSVKAVDDLDPAVRFVIRYKNLHGKVKERKHIASFLAALQRAIIKNQIGKDNSYSREISNIQQQLIRTLKLMAGEIKINIEQESLEKYQRIADSEKIRLSVAYIKRFISLADKTEVREKAERLLNQIDNAVDAKKITDKDKYKEEIDEIRKYLFDYVNSHSKKMKVDEFTLNGFQQITGDQKKNDSSKITDDENLGFINVVDVVKGASSYVTGRKVLDTIDKVSEKASPKGIINSNQLREMEFELLPFSGVWLDIFGKVSQPFFSMVFGMPGSGKSTFNILFAKYVANGLDLKVLYIASEEGFTYTLREKFERLDAFSEKIDIAYRLPANIKEYDFIFIDSVNELGFDPDEVGKLIMKGRQHQTSIVFIYRATKDGKYKGLSENEHLVDVSIKVENGLTLNQKNRFGGKGRMNVFEYTAS